MIGIVILNYNNWEDTYKCLLSFLNLRIQTKYKIYLVDNCSTKPMPINVDKIVKFYKISYILSPINKGYSAGNNLGISKALEDGCEVIFVSNNDVIFQENILDGMYEYLKSNENIGIVAPKVMLPSGRMQETNMKCKLTLKGKYQYMLRNTPFKKYSEKFLNDFQIKEDDLKKHTEVFSVSGCFFAISKECIEKIGLFDENVFLYMEEYILGIKMEEKGLKVMILPEFQIVHFHGQSTKKTPSFSFICMIESERYYLKEYLKCSDFQILGIVLIRTAQYVIRCFKYKDYRFNFKTFLRNLLN